MAALKLIRASSFNCYVYEERSFDSIESKASLIQQKVGPFADPCTYRLICKNVTKLVPVSQANLVSETDDSLEGLLRSYHLLDEALDSATFNGDEAAAGKVQDRLAACQASLSRFEASIRACLRMAPISA